MKGMRKIKRIGAVLLAAIMALSLCTTAFGATDTGSSGTDEVYGTQDDTGVIKAYGIDDDSDTLTVVAYPIVLATYDDNGNFSGYKSLYETYINLDEYDAATNPNGALKSVTTGEGDDAVTTYYYEFTEEQLANIRSAIADSNAATVSDGSYGTAAADSYTLTSGTDEGGDYYSNNAVAVGAYLIEVKNADTVIYNVAVASCYYTTILDDDEETVTIVTNDNLVYTLDGITEGDAWMKAETPVVDKDIVGVNGEATEEGNSKGTSVNVGDTIDYEVTVNEIPYYSGDYPVYKLTDTLSAGLTLLPETVTGDDGTVTHPGIVVQVPDAIATETPDGEGGFTVTYGTVTLTENVDYTVTITPATGKGDDDLAGATVEINFVFESTNDEGGTDYTYTLNAYEGLSIDVTYSVMLNDAAVLDNNPNDNTVDLEYSLDSDVEDDIRDEEVKTHTYTFSIDGYLDGDTDGSSATWNEQGSLTYNILTKTGADWYTTDGDGNRQSASQSDEGAINPLQGAVFTLYTVDPTDDDFDAETDIYTNGDNEDHDNFFGGTVTSDINGKLTITGLAPGTYYLQETKAPFGYTRNTNVYKIVIDATYREDGTLASWSIDIQVKGAGEDTYTDLQSNTFTVNQTTDTTSEPVEGTYTVGAETVVINGQTYTLASTLVDSEGDGKTEYLYNASWTVVDEDTGRVTAYTATATATVTYGTDVNGQPTTDINWTIVQTATADTATNTDIANTRLIDLPSTGAMGTILFTLLGCLLIAMAAWLLMLLRRRILAR